MTSAKRRNRLVLYVVLVVLLLTYVGSYVTLSRNALVEADRQDAVGFYFFPPQNTNAWRRENYGCVYLFYPLIYIDNLIGTGRPVGSEPLWNLR